MQLANHCGIAASSNPIAVISERILSVSDCQFAALKNWTPAASDLESQYKHMPSCSCHNSRKGPAALAEICLIAAKDLLLAGEPNLWLTLARNARVFALSPAA